MAGTAGLRPVCVVHLCLVLITTGLCSSTSRPKKTIGLHVVCDKSCRFSQLNTLVVLVDLEVWNGVDILNTTGVIDLFSLRSLFGDYRHRQRLQHAWSDASILITGTNLASTPGGSDDNGAFMTGCLCERSNAAGVVKYRGQPASHLAATMVHELGHALGMEHDRSGCCPAGDGNCIMAPLLNQRQIQHPLFSNCSEAYFVEFLRTTRSSCLDDEPLKAFPLPGISICGNGVVDDGEDCDCPEGCVGGCCACCDGNCRLKPAAECWKGGCCTRSCQFAGRGTVCSPSSTDSCDLADTCTGTSAQCPASHVVNGIECSQHGQEAGYCFNGQCLTPDGLCATAWNPGYRSASDACYRTSLTYSSSMAHCGPVDNRPGFYQKCTENSGVRFFRCGLLQCQYSRHPAYTERDIDRSRQPEYNIFVPGRCMNGNSYMWEAGRGRPLMIADGTKCGEDKVCLDTSCVDKESAYAVLANRTVERLGRSQSCGDGLVEGDEECDCGALQCDCCDEKCKYVPRGVKCRFTECRVCSGRSSGCARNTGMRNFEQCADGGHCFRRKCVSLLSSCKKYFGHSARPAHELYRDSSQRNDTQTNIGGYKLHHQSSGDVVEQEYRHISNRECGVLMCQAHSMALVFDCTGQLLKSKTSRSGESAMYRYAYYHMPRFHLGEQGHEVYYPLLAEHGTPCVVGGRPGFCNRNHFARSRSGTTWYWYSSCQTLPGRNPGGRLRSP